MPTFTLELWRVLEFYPSDDYSGIGLDQYPIFDENYRESLNEKIVNHYHNREIGQETVSMWKFAMKRKMAEIMPYYNSLYETTKLQFDPFATVDIKTMTSAVNNTNATSEGDSKTGSTGNAKSRAVNSSLPQNQLAGNKDYATSAADTISDSKNAGNAHEASSSTSHDDSSSESTTKGYQAMPADLLTSYRNTILNIDMLVIEELRDMFMLVWNNGDEYTRMKGYTYR